MRKILIHAHLAVDNAKWTDPHTKANAMLQAHFARSNLSADLQADQRVVVPLATRLLQARPPPSHAPHPKCDGHSSVAKRLFLVLAILQ